MEIFFVDDWGDEVSLDVKPKKEVCPECDGEGSHIHNAFRYDSFSPYDADREGVDFHETVKDMVSGRYDVVCSECKGLRVVDVPDLSCLTESELKSYQETLRINAECERMMRVERKMGA